MGLNDVYIAFIDDCINTSMKNFRGKKMLELGNQIIRKGNISESFESNLKFNSSSAFFL